MVCLMISPDFHPLLSWSAGKLNPLPPELGIRVKKAFDYRTKDLLELVSDQFLFEYLMDLPPRASNSLVVVAFSSKGIILHLVTICSSLGML